jgi:uncharacterized protein (DUF302 family)
MFSLSETSMSYYFSKTLEMPFVQAIQHVTEALAGKGFGVLTTIDVRATMKKKLDIDFRPYTILGACNPQFAHKALQAEGDSRGPGILPSVCSRTVDRNEFGGVVWPCFQRA